MAERKHNPRSETAKVSILVAIYNIEKFAGKCIQSIIDQSYNNIEIILVDDCSTDSSGKICEDFAKRDRRVSVTHHVANTRLPGVRNTGLAQATGDYIMFVDGDDWLAPDCTAYMLDLIQTTRSDMAISLNNFSTRDNRQVTSDKFEIWSPEKATAEMLFPHIAIGCWNKIYRRDFIEKHHLRFHTDLFTAEGARFINDAAQRARHIGVGRRKVYYYRLNNTGSATTKPDVRQGIGALYALEGMERDLIIRTPYVLNALHQHIWKNHIWTLRLILATKSEKENSELLERCKEYIRHHAYKVASNESSIAKKLRFCLAGIAPTLAARFINVRFSVGLLLDIRKNKGKEDVTN